MVFFLKRFVKTFILPFFFFNQTFHFCIVLGLPSLLLFSLHHFVTEKGGKEKERREILENWESSKFCLFNFLKVFFFFHGTYFWIGFASTSAVPCNSMQCPSGDRSPVQILQSQFRSRESSGPNTGCGQNPNGDLTEDWEASAFANCWAELCHLAFLFSLWGASRLYPWEKKWSGIDFSELSHAFKTGQKRSAPYRCLCPDEGPGVARAAAVRLITFLEPDVTWVSVWLGKLQISNSPGPSEADFVSSAEITL